MKKRVLIIVMVLGTMSVHAQDVEPNDVPFVPWGVLEVVEDLGPTWLKSDDWTEYLYTVNDGAYALSFGLARSDGGPRGANALKFVHNQEEVGHHVANQVQGYFDVINTGDTNTFEDLVILVALDANQLNPDFGLKMWTDANESLFTFDPARDFVWYDPCALGYDTGRPSGIYPLTTPSYEPVAYLFDQGLISQVSFEQVNLAPSASARFYYAFDCLQAKAVFSVYGSVNKNGKRSIYHSNRSVANPENSKEQVSTFAALPHYLQADLDGNGLINLRDVAFLGQCMGQTVADDPNQSCAPADLDMNGQVDMEDTAAFLGLIQDYFDMNDPNETLPGS
jgi:hypothetical protein